MVKKMAYDLKSWWRSLQQKRHLVLLSGISVLLLALVFGILCNNRASVVSLVSKAPFIDHSQISTSTVDSQGIKENNTIHEFLDSEETCNLFIGDWVPYGGDPSYTNSSCSFIEDHQNCMKNGRPDKDYLYWRWKPHGCELARVDRKKFLELMRNKSWAFIGDSISRNHAQSFLCILSTVSYC